MTVHIITQTAQSHTFENYAAKEVKKSLEHLGVSVHIVCLANGYFNEYLATLSSQRPDWVCSFPDPYFPLKLPLFEQMGIPHFYWASSSFSPLLKYHKEPLATLGWGGRAYCRWFQSQGHNAISFMPLGVDCEHSFDEDRPFDVVLFDSLIDIHHLEKVWEEFFTKDCIQLFKDIIATCLEDTQQLPLAEIYQRLHFLGVDTEKISIEDMLFSIDEYLKAKKIAECIESFEDLKIHVFGEHVGNSWLKRLKNGHNVYLHWPVPYAEHLRILKKSKILIRDQNLWDDGSDEWTLAAMQCGCLPITNGSPYFHEIFQEDAFFYPSGDWKAAVDKTRLFLQESKKRIALTDSLRIRTKEIFSWDQRVKELVSVMDSTVCLS